MGPVHALRLPHALEAWFEQRLRDLPDRSASSLLLELIHSGLRLSPGYMMRHRQSLEELSGTAVYEVYVGALRQTFGASYVAHVETWVREAREERAACKSHK